MSSGHEPPYVRLDDKGLQKIFDKMKALASKYELHELDEDLDALEASLGGLAYQDNASGLYTPEGSVTIETTKDVVSKSTYTLDGENLIIGSIPVEVITGANGAFTGSEGNISVS